MYQEKGMLTCQAEGKRGNMEKNFHTKEKLQEQAATHHECFVTTSAQYMEKGKSLMKEK